MVDARRCSSLTAAVALRRPDWAEGVIARLHSFGRLYAFHVTIRRRLAAVQQPLAADGPPNNWLLRWFGAEFCRVREVALIPIRRRGKLAVAAASAYTSRTMGRTVTGKTLGYGLTTLRILNGVLMAGHGLQKLRGWFGGSGIDGTAAGFEHLGLRPGRRHAVLAGVTETASGAMMALGVVTPVASAATTGLMTVAIRKVHFKNGLWATKGGYEYNLTLAAAAFVLADLGAGPLAVDGRFLQKRAGLSWAIAQLVVGVVSALALLELSTHRTDPPESSPESAHE